MSEKEKRASKIRKSFRAASLGSLKDLAEIHAEDPPYFSRMGGDGGVTPLHEACRNGHLECVLFLLGVGSPMAALDGRKHTPLHVAAQEGYVECVIALLNAGAPVFNDPSDEEAPLLLAANYARDDCAAALLKAGADPSIQNRHGITPLHGAAWNGEEPAALVIRLLVNAGANLEVRDINSNTPLLLAALHGEDCRLWAVLELLRLGADPAARDKEGRTPEEVGNTEKIRGLCCAAREKKMLLDGGVSPPDGIALKARL